MYVLQRIPDGAFVADMSKSRRGGSYTRNLQEARTFSTREAADRDRCVENERIRSVDDVMRYGR